MVAVACGQKADDTFTKPVYFNFGLTTTRITFPDGTSMISVPTGTGGSVTWDAILNKPLTFAPSVHSHDLLYKAITYVPTWAEITGKPTFFSGSYTDLTNKPTEIELQQAISELNVILIPKKTTAEIALMTPVAGSFVYDITLNVLKIGNGTVFKVLITAN